MDILSTALTAPEPFVAPAALPGVALCPTTLKFKFIGWDEDAINFLRARVGAGDSSGVIAHAMHCTRNMIIGKVRRLGLKLAGLSSSEVGRLAREARQREMSARQREKFSLGDRKKRQDRRRELAREKRQAAPVEPFIPRFVETSVAHMPADVVPILVETSEHLPRMCCWPIGDPLGPEFRWCGYDKVVERSYCAHHLKVACYTPRGGERSNRFKVSRYGHRLTAPA